MIRSLHLLQKPRDIPLQEPHRFPEPGVNGLKVDFCGLQALMAQKLGDHRQGHLLLIVQIARHEVTDAVIGVVGHPGPLADVPDQCETVLVAGSG